MSRFDTETLIKKCLTLVQAELNTKIQEINTEKGDFEIDTIEPGAYYFAQLPAEVYNYSAFVVYGFMNNPTLESSNEFNQIKSLEIFFEVVSVDAGENEGQNVIYKLLRYSRALEDIFNKNFSKIMEGYGKIQVSNLTPTTLFSMEGKTVRSAGVSVTARITSN